MGLEPTATPHPIRTLLLDLDDTLYQVITSMSFLLMPKPVDHTSKHPNALCFPDAGRGDATACKTKDTW
jgi:hypothetical protein